MPAVRDELLAANDEEWFWNGLAGEGSARLERFASLMPDRRLRLTSELWSAFAHMACRKDCFRALEAAATAVRLARSVNDAEVLARALNAYASNLTLARACSKTLQLRLRRPMLSRRPGTSGCASGSRTRKLFRVT
jgi:hypothetical protein